MYTLQSGQIENALRSGDLSDMAAKEMVQGLANCQQVIEHRSNVELTKPVINYFPTVLPASNSVSFPTILKNITINVPPFQMKEWEPLPYIPLPPWQNTPYKPWPGWGWDDLLGGGSGAAPAPGDTPDGPTLRVPGGATLGPAIIRDIQSGPITCTNLIVNGDLLVTGNATINQNLNVGGDTHLGGDLTVNNTTTLNGPTYMSGPVYVGGTPLTPFTISFVSKVFWDAGALKQTLQTVTVFGVVQGSADSTVISGTECP